MTLHKNRVCIVSYGDGSQCTCSSIAWSKAQQSEHINEQSTKQSATNSAALHSDRREFKPRKSSCWFARLWTASDYT